MKLLLITIMILHACQSRADDAIAKLVNRLNSEVGGLWMNGGQPSFSVPTNATPSNAVLKVAEAWRINKGTNSPIEILEIRSVELKGPQNMDWKAALIKCDSGRKVLLMGHYPHDHWWTRFYDEE